MTCSVLRRSPASRIGSRVSRWAIGLAIAAPLLAHGGQYRGPGSPPFLPGPPTPGAPGSPTTGPFTPGPGDPSQGPPLDSWQFWWEYNKDRYIALRESVLGPATRAPDGSTVAGPVDRRPTETELVDQVIPAIVRAMGTSDSPDLTGAGLVALGKIGRLHPEIDVPQELRGRLGRGSQEVRETAALSLGISGLDPLLDDLLGLAQDSPSGRRVAGRTPVEDRVRAFAFYGLGLAARGKKDSGLQRRVYDIARQVLEERTIPGRDVTTAAIHALGVMSPDPAVADQKRLLWETLVVLERFMARDLGRGDEVVQAHVPTAIARLIGRGDDVDHVRLISAWCEEIHKRRRADPVLQSMVLALGEMALPRDAGDAMKLASETLEKVHEDGKDQGSRYFALMSLAKIGGEDNRAYLMRELPRGQKGTERPWLALALGVLGRADLERGGAPDALLAALLLKNLRDNENDDVRSACAVSLGLIRHAPAVPEMLRLLGKHRRRDQLAGYLCLGLGMIGDPSATPALAAILGEADFRPILLTQAAIGYALIDPTAAGEALARMLHTKDGSIGRLAGIATAFRYIGDRRAIAPLLRELSAKDNPDIARAFLVAALGGVCDRNPLPWNEPYARGVNYQAPIVTLANGVTGVLDIL